MERHIPAVQHTAATLDFILLVTTREHVQTTEHGLALIQFVSSEVHKQFSYLLHTVKPSSSAAYVFNSRVVSLRS
jgi:hypothetical protein